MIFARNSSLLVATRLTVVKHERTHIIFVLKSANRLIKIFIWLIYALTLMMHLRISPSPIIG